MPPTPAANPPTPGLREAFERAAPAYDRHAALEREVADRLLERASFQRAEPRRIVDLGCGTGYCAETLKRRYRKADVVGLDFALGMCRQAKARSGLLRPLRIVCADVGALPFADRSMDLVVANLAFQWQKDFSKLFNGLRRIMRPGALLLFTSLGPGALRELRSACAAAVPDAGFRPFPDMHEIGDGLVAAGFDEPVMDTETLTLSYPALEALLTELEATGAASHVAEWNSVRAAAATLTSTWPRNGGTDRFPLSWEIVYGAAFGPDEGRPVKTAGGDVATFSVEALRGSRRRH